MGTTPGQAPHGSAARGARDARRDHRSVPLTGVPAGRADDGGGLPGAVGAAGDLESFVLIDVGRRCPNPVGAVAWQLLVGLAQEGRTAAAGLPPVRGRGTFREAPEPAEYLVERAMAL